MKKPNLIILLSLISIHAISQEKINQDFKAEIELEDRIFMHSGLYEGQKQNFLSIAAQPEYYLNWNDGKYSFKATLFGRWDQYDNHRTHFDIRELYWQGVFGRHEVSVGLKEIYWGVTESAHIVNIINQTDVVESFDGEAKLGQPMVHYSYESKVGIFDIFLMPYFRTITYPGEKGRLRTPIVLEGDEFPFESKQGKYHPDVAVRWSNYIGVFDIGVSYFYGNGRQPLVSDIQQFEPFYGLVHQTGLDLQATTGPILWKFEGIYNKNSIKNYTSLAAGFEYTFSNVDGNGLDIGILSEYLFDSRDELTIGSMEDDLFTGFRLAFNDINDSQVLAGAIYDLKYSSQVYSIEASRRIKEFYTINLEGRFFHDVAPKEFLYFIRDDSFFKLAVTRYF